MAQNLTWVYPSKYWPPEQVWGICSHYFGEEWNRNIYVRFRGAQRTFKLTHSHPGFPLLQMNLTRGTPLRREGRTWMPKTKTKHNKKIPLPSRSATSNPTQLSPRQIKFPLCTWEGICQVKREPLKSWVHAQFMRKWLFAPGGRQEHGFTWLFWKSGLMK